MAQSTVVFPFEYQAAIRKFDRTQADLALSQSNLGLSPRPYKPSTALRGKSGTGKSSKKASNNRSRGGD